MLEIVQVEDGFKGVEHGEYKWYAQRIKVELRRTLQEFWYKNERLRRWCVDYKDESYFIVVPFGLFAGKGKDVTLEVRDGKIVVCTDFDKECLVNCQKYPKDNFDNNIKTLRAKGISYTYDACILRAQGKTIKRYDTISVVGGVLTVNKHKVLRAFYYRDASAVMELVNKKVPFYYNGNGVLIVGIQEVKLGQIVVFDIENMIYTHEQFLEKFELC